MFPNLKLHPRPSPRSCAPLGLSTKVFFLQMRVPYSGVVQFKNNIELKKTEIETLFKKIKYSNIDPVREDKFHVFLLCFIIYTSSWRQLIETSQLFPGVRPSGRETPSVTYHLLYHFHTFSFRSHEYFFSSN